MKATTPLGDAAPGGAGATVAAKTTDWPLPATLVDWYSTSAVARWATVCTSGVEDECAVSASPLYTAVIAWVPAPRARVVKRARLGDDRGTVPSTVEPSRNVTVPVSV